MRGKSTEGVLTMNRSIRSKLVAVGAVLLGALGLAQAAQARTDVVFSIGLPAPAYIEPAPVYVEPAPVYVQPRPVYVEPAPVYVTPRYAYEREWRREQWRRWHRWHERHDGYYGRY
jgi:hypothetical protein